jgi:MerR family transcriptional regulator/heat shock protein HspR
MTPSKRRKADALCRVDTDRINPYTWIGATLNDLYFISVAARMLGMHPQTLRKYERLGLVQPTRTMGSMRVYSRDELERLKLIKRLVDDAGINLAGVQRLLSIAEVVQRIRPLMRDDSLSARDARRRLTQELDALTQMLGLD